MDVNSLKANLLITVLVGALVCLLPWADRRICRRLKLNLHGGLSENPEADRLLRLRECGDRHAPRNAEGRRHCNDEAEKPLSHFRSSSHALCTPFLAPDVQTRPLRPTAAEMNLHEPI